MMVMLPACGGIPAAYVKSDAEISAAIGGIWRVRDDRYSELRTAETAALPKVEMSYIGG
jgi:cyclic pyranopterin phosphate synthase